MNGRGRPRVALVICLLAVVGITGGNSIILSLAASAPPSTPSASAASLVQEHAGSKTTATTTAVGPTATATATTMVATNCSELPTLEQAPIDRDDLPDLDQNMTSGDALEFAVGYETAYAEAHVVPDEAGMSEPTATVNQTGNGYLVTVSYIYGGTSVITAQPSDDQSTPATTVIEWDQFIDVYYYVSPSRVLRSAGAEPPEHPQTDGQVVSCDA